jgi:hypothetical protein
LRVGKVLATGNRRTLWLAYARRGGKAYVSNVLPARAPKTFCIATTPRTGSELLVGLFNQHPGVRCESELLNYQPHFPYAYLRGKARAAAFRGFAAHGFKLMAYQVMNYYSVPDRRLVTKLASDGCHFIHLRRRNTLRQAVSYFRASISQDWHRSLGGRPRGGAPTIDWRQEFEPVGWRTGAASLDELNMGVALEGPIVVDVPTLLFALRLIEIQNNGLSWMLSGFPVRELWYEDDIVPVARHQPTMDGLCRWLRLDSHPVTAKLEKMASPRLEDEVANLDEIRRALESTRYAAMIDTDSRR